mmetsp:Transcript_2096/g.4865  ORF Transcript_2096/g.4865 Transcript_2096/m.4865 type:complete len:167 (+) Transcript_2096:1524-2024(+)
MTDSERFQRTLVAWMENVDSMFGELGRSLDMLGMNAKVAGTAGRKVGRLLRASPMFSASCKEAAGAGAGGSELKPLTLPSPLGNNQKSLPISLSLAATTDPPDWGGPLSARASGPERADVPFDDDDNEDIDNSTFFANALHRVATTAKPEAGCASTTSCGIGRDYI